jgi:hypothetical protein
LPFARSGRTNAPKSQEAIIDRRPTGARGIVARLAPWQWLAAIFLVALAVNLAFGWLVRFRPVPDILEADEREYFDLSTRLLDHSLTLSARRTLGYPAALAAIRLLGANFLMLQVAMAVLYSLSAPMLTLVVRRLRGDWLPAGLAGLALALWPPAIFYGTSLYSETLALPIFLAALALLPAAPDRRMLPAVGAGLLLALATHVRPMYLLFTPFVALIFWLEWRRLWPAVRLTLLVAAGYSALILPWSAYVSHHFGHPVLVSSNGGETFGGGLNPVLLATHGQFRVGDRLVGVGPGKWLPPEQTGYLDTAELALPYDRQDALLRARTAAWVEAHPGDAAYLELSKFGYMWGFQIADNQARQLLFGNLPTILLLIVVAVLFVRDRDARGRLARLWLPACFVSCVALISWGSWRFRMPGDAGLIAFAVSCGWAEFARRRRSAPDAPDRPGDASRADRASPYPGSAR